MKNRAFAPVVVGILAASTPAIAQEAGAFRLEQFEPGEPATSILNVSRADVTGHTDWSVAVASHYAAEPLVLVRGGETESRLVAGTLTAEVLGSFGLFDVVDLGLAMPFALSQTGDDLAVAGRAGDSISGAAPGDLRLAQRVIIPLDGPVGAGVQSTVYLPTGDEDSFLSDGSVRWEPRLLVDGEFGPLTVAANAGYQLRPESRLQNAVVDDAVRWGIGVNWNVADVHSVRGVVFGSFQLQPDLDPADPTSTADRNSTSPVETLLAYSIELPLGLHGSVGGGTALNDHVGAAAWRAVLAVGYRANAGQATVETTGAVDDEGRESPTDEPVSKKELPGDLDADGDGVPDARDGCPNQAGPEASGGCPGTELLKMDGESLSPTVKVVHPRTGELTPDGKRVVEQLAGFLGGAGPSVAGVSVEVHYFEADDPAINQARSQEIAERVRSAIVAAGVEPARITAKGLGDTRRLEGVELETRVDFKIEQRRKYQRLQE